MKYFDGFRAKRRQVYEGLFSAKVLCIAGFIIMPALLFNSITFFRVFQFLLFWFLAWLSGKKNNPLITLLIIFGIIIFNLFVPYGEILVSFGKFSITSGALMAGIHRAVTLEGLIMLSRVTIRRDLKIPGLFGELIGESFRIFAVIMDKKQRITRKNLIGDIDNLMIELSSSEAEASGASAITASNRTKPMGFVIIAIVAIIAWLPMVYLAIEALTPAVRP